MSSQNRPARIYIGNLPDDVHEREIEKCFAEFGEIRDIDLKRGRSSNGTAFAFVEYSGIRAAERAIDQRNNVRFGDRRLRVEFSGERGMRRTGLRSGPPRRTDFRVVITGLPPSASWQDLKDHMRQAGNVGYADARNGRGIVEYETEADMRYAIRKLDRSEFRNPFTRSEIRVRAECDDAGGGSRSPSPPRGGPGHGPGYYDDRGPPRDGYYGSDRGEGYYRDGGGRRDDGPGGYDGGGGGRGDYRGEPRDARDMRDGRDDRESRDLREGNGDRYGSSSAGRYEGGSGERGSGDSGADRRGGYDRRDYGRGGEDGGARRARSRSRSRSDDAGSGRGYRRSAGGEDGSRERADGRDYRRGGARLADDDDDADAAADGGGGSRETRRRDGDGGSRERGSPPRRLPSRERSEGGGPEAPEDAEAATGSSGGGRTADDREHDREESRERPERSQRSERPERPERVREIRRGSGDSTGSRGSGDAVPHRREVRRASHDEGTDRERRRSTDPAAAGADPVSVDAAA